MSGLDAAQATMIMDYAVEVDNTVFDTADVYAQGASERIVGEWVRAHPGTDVLIQTNTGNTATGPDLSPEHVASRLQHPSPHRAWELTTTDSTQLDIERSRAFAPSMLPRGPH
ncbi:aldo/keto reductase [Rhodococcoides fascians]|uniref:aldo/keto reductase n=1 Tax=Rhodococcoides fascians TaxID=1828 RepID=UPI0018AFCEEA|nr:aldo/keto reductase [Rhodococcus fascians]